MRRKYKIENGLAAFVVFYFLLSTFSFAACPSGVCNAASPAISDVSAAVAQAGLNETVIVPDGTANWGTSTLTLTKGITLKTAHGRDSTIITTNITATAGIIFIDHPSNTGTIRIEGFTFDGNNAIHPSGTTIGILGDAYFNNLAVGNNRWRNFPQGSTIIYLRGQFRGVVYNNLMDRCEIILRSFGYSVLAEWENLTFAYGSSDNMFFENNTITYSSALGGNGAGWTEMSQGGRVVERYNTWNFTNEQSPNNNTVLDSHGFNGYPIPQGGQGQTGTMIIEFYGNTIINSGGAASIVHRGSWGMFHNNIYTGAGENKIQAQQYPDGCTVNIPGAPGNYIAEINNTYGFNNTLNGSGVINVTEGAFHLACGCTENLSWYNYNPSFGNGTNGIGRGTSAPTTTGNPNNAGYWVNNPATPSVDPNIVQAGHLYKRVLGAWVDYYHPYTYPHPLVTGGATPTPTPAGYPVINTQPASITITAGQTPTFSISMASSGGLQFTYVWKKNGVVVYSPAPTGSTSNAYNTAPPATMADSGSIYTCVVSTSAGSVTSNNATLTVLPAPFALPTWHSIDGSIKLPFVINGGDSTISQAEETTDPTNGGEATYPFTVPNPANATGYTISALMNCPDDASNSLFLAIDSQPIASQIWYIPVTTGLESRDVIISPETAPHVWMLTSGLHQLIIRGREANARLGDITFNLVGNPSPTPTPTATPTAVLPTFNPNGGAGPFESLVAVTLSTTTTGGTMQYTIDGTDSRSATTLLPYTTPIPVDHSLRIKAFTSATGYLDSPQATSQPYVIYVATPVLTSSTGSFTATGMLSVTITDATPNSVWYYSVDGTTPSIPYGVPVVVNASCTFKAMATKIGCTDSAIKSQAIVINSPTPTPTPTATASATATPTVTPAPATGLEWIAP